jgi:hypothetical protein
MATVDDTFNEAQRLATEILNLLDECDVSAGLSALNYCLARMLVDTYGGSEDVLARSDEQTRFVVRLLASEKVVH